MMEISVNHENQNDNEVDWLASTDQPLHYPQKNNAENFNMKQSVRY